MASRPHLVPHRRARVLALVAVGVLGLAACAPSDYHYVKNSDAKTYFKVPSGWKFYDAEAFLDGTGQTLSRSERAALLATDWRVAFDASPNPSFAHVGKLAKAHPVGFALVRNLSSDESDVASELFLRNLFVDIDTASDDQRVDTQSYSRFQVDGGFRGVRYLVKYTTTSGKHAEINQVALLDQANSRVYALIVSCSTSCYAKYASKIDEVTKSWTVRD